MTSFGMAKKAVTDPRAPPWHTSHAVSRPRTHCDGSALYTAQTTVYVCHPNLDQGIAKQSISTARSRMGPARTDCCVHYIL